MLLKTRGIVFRAIKYGDTSVIADIYTKEEGLRTFIIGGVRKQKSNFSPGLLQVMSIVDLVAYFRVDKDMHRIKEMIPAEIYDGISYNIVKSSVGLFMIEVAQKTIREAEQNVPLYDFLETSFLLLDNSKHSLANFPMGFLLELSTFLGFRPDLSRKKEQSLFDLREGRFIAGNPGHIYFLNEEYSDLLWNLLSTELHQIHNLDIEKNKRKNLLHELIQFYRLHLEHFHEVKALNVLETVLNA